MAKLCYITTCKGRLEHLKQSLPSIAGQRGVSCIVVDYSCPEGAGDWVEAHFPQVRVVRVEGEPIFNRSRARNFGAAAADAPWLAFLDADVVLDPAFVGTVLTLLKRGYYYRPSPLFDQIAGEFIIHRDDFDAVGGFDEIYSGWGAEDIDMVDAMATVKVRPATFPSSLLTAIHHSNEMRLRFHENQDIWLQDQINNVYRHLKYDLRRMLGRSLSAPEARPIYAEVIRQLNQTAARDRFAPTFIRINLADFDIIHGDVVGDDRTTRIESSLLYKVQPRRRPTV
jgi:GT2 family glycosyltransferase